MTLFDKTSLRRIKRVKTPETIFFANVLPFFFLCFCFFLFLSCSSSCSCSYYLSHSTVNRSSPSSPRQFVILFRFCLPWPVFLYHARSIRGGYGAGIGKGTRRVLQACRICEKGISALAIRFHRSFFFSTCARETIS